jgi:hypothetical protein
VQRDEAAPMERGTPDSDVLRYGVAATAHDAPFSGFRYAICVMCVNYGRARKSQIEHRKFSAWVGMDSIASCFPV